MAPLTNGRKKINGQRGMASFSLDKEACRAGNNGKIRGINAFADNDNNDEDEIY